MINRTSCKVVGAILLIAAFYFTYQIVPYAVANFQYEQLAAKNNLSKNEVENELFFYSSRKIPIEESLWGKKENLEAGEECWQYLILWKETIDIVYDDKGKVVHIFSSYE